jgi:hypothetical protein
MTDAVTERAPERFESLEAMRASHANLLRQLPAEGLSGADTKCIQDFLKQAVATGTLLDNPAERKAAQALLDYWRSTLYAETRGRGLEQAASVSAGQRLQDSVLAPFDANTVNGVVRQTETVVAAMTPDELELTRRLLLRMVRLAADRRGFEAEPAALASLAKVGGTPEQVQGLIGRLVDVGVLRKHEDERYGLAYEALARSWSRLRNWLEQRLRFRDTAQYWDKHGRNPAALISDALLDEAHEYHDRDKLEDEFVHASRKLERSVNRRYKVWAFVFAALAGVAIMCAMAAIWFAIQASANAKQARANADQAKANADHAEQAKQHAQQQEKIAREQKVRADTVSAELRQRRQLDMMMQLARTAALGATAELKQAEWEIARQQAESLKQDLQDDDIAKMLADNAPLHATVKKLLDALQAETWSEKVPDLALDLGRKLRKQLFPPEDPHAARLLHQRRRIIYNTYYLYGKWIVETLKRKQAISVAMPLVDELRVYYYGQMVVVEDSEVEKAEIAFKNKLEEIEDSAVRHVDKKQFLSLTKELQTYFPDKRAINQPGKKITYGQITQIAQSAPAAWDRMSKAHKQSVEQMSATGADAKQVKELEALLEKLKQQMGVELKEKVGRLGDHMVIPDTTPALAGSGPLAPNRISFSRFPHFL